MSVRVALYFRVSTTQQAASGLGLEAQQEACRAFAKTGGFKVVSEHTDAGVSGAAKLSKRPGLSDAINAVLAGEADFILAAKLDRVSRDPLCLLQVERMLGKKNSRVISVAGEGTQSDDPSAVLMRRILAAVAENERALISARTSAALRAKKARGERSAGRPPFGFRVGAEGKMEAHPENFKTLLLMCELADAGVKQKELAEIFGISQPAVSLRLKRWKKGSRNHRQKNLRAFAAEVERGEHG